MGEMTMASEGVKILECLKTCSAVWIFLGQSSLRTCAMARALSEPFLKKKGIVNQKHRRECLMKSRSKQRNRQIYLHGFKNRADWTRRMAVKIKS